MLAACGGGPALKYNMTTGRISPAAVPSQCLAAVQKQKEATTAPALILTECGGPPSDSQQFQYNPATGALTSDTDTDFVVRAQVRGNWGLSGRTERAAAVAIVQHVAATLGDARAVLLPKRDLCCNVFCTIITPPVPTIRRV